MRQIREIVESIEQKLDSLSIPTKKPTTRTYPNRLSPEARDALECVLPEMPKSYSYDQLMNAMLDVSPDCVVKGGYTNSSLRSAICELHGLKVRWAK